MRIMAAGKFDACYLFVDNVENIVKNGKTNLRQFATQLGGALFRDNVYSNTAGFLGIFLTTHAQAAQMLAKEWRECGYQTRAELHAHPRKPVMITRLTSAGGEKMIAEYLQFFRSEAVDDPLFPFNKDAVHELAEKSQYHPAQMLRTCHKVLLNAVEEGSNTHFEGVRDEKCGIKRRCASDGRRARGRPHLRRLRGLTVHNRARPLQLFGPRRLAQDRPELEVPLGV